MRCISMILIICIWIDNKQIIIFVTFFLFVCLYAWIFYVPLMYVLDKNHFFSFVDVYFRKKHICAVCLANTRTFCCYCQKHTHLAFYLTKVCAFLLFIVKSTHFWCVCGKNTHFCFVRDKNTHILAFYLTKYTHFCFLLSKTYTMLMFLDKHRHILLFCLTQTHTLDLYLIKINICLLFL